MAVDPLAVAVLLFVTAQRLAEVAYAGRNTQRLLAAGAVEHGAGHYPAMVVIHTAWLVGLWWLAIGIRPDLFLLAVFALLQLARVWVLATLGPRWTTRIIVVPGETLVARGPYRFVRHPNYVVAFAEIVVLPLAFGLVLFAALFAALKLAILYVRIRAEDAALAASR
jgi:methyltransferase